MHSISRLVLLFTILLLTGVGIIARAQEREFADFKTALFAFHDLRNEKLQGVTATEANKQQYERTADDAFLRFALDRNSHHQFGDPTPLPRSGNLRLHRLQLNDGLVGELRVSTYVADGHHYAAIGYEIEFKWDYVIKDLDSNAIIFRRSNAFIQPCMVETIFGLDSERILVVEKNGFIHQHRSAFVLQPGENKKAWIQLDAFEGLAYGTPPAYEPDKKYLRRRNELRFFCNDIFASLSLGTTPLSFENSSKTLSYVRPPKDGHSKTVRARWVNQVFVIDDYDTYEDRPPIELPYFPQ